MALSVMNDEFVAALKVRSHSHECECESESGFPSLVERSRSLVQAHNSTRVY